MLVFFICVEAIIYWLLYNLHGCTFNIDNDSSIPNSHLSKFTKGPSTSIANTSEALIITKGISDKNKTKNDVINTASDNQNLDNDTERVRKMLLMLKTS